MRELGFEPPAEYLSAPSPLPGVDPLLEAFFELCHDRAMGYGAIGPIPFTAIDRYAARYGWDDPDEFDLLRLAIRAADVPWLEAMNSRPPSPGEDIAAPWQR